MLTIFNSVYLGVYVPVSTGPPEVRDTWSPRACGTAVVSPPNMGSGHSGLLRDQHPLLTTKPLLQPESDSALQAGIPTPSSDTARQVGMAGGCEGHSLGKEEKTRKGREKHAEICSTKWESFCFVIKPWPYCLGAKLASLFIIFCSCNRRVNAENPSKTVGVNAAGYMWHACGCGVWRALEGMREAERAKRECSSEY